MGTSVFMRQEYERKIATETIDFAKLKASSISLPDKSRHSQTLIAEKWDQIKLLRSLDLERLRQQKDCKLVTEQDWLVGAILALNKGEPLAIEASKTSLPEQESEQQISAVIAPDTLKPPTEDKEEDTKEEVIPTGDSSNVGRASSQPREDVDMQTSTDAPLLKKEEAQTEADKKEHLHVATSNVEPKIEATPEKEMLSQKTRDSLYTAI